VNRAVRIIVHNWPLKVLAVILAFLLYSGLVVSQSTFEYPGSVRIEIVNQPTDAVVLGNLPPVTRIRYIVNGKIRASSLRAALESVLRTTSSDASGP